MPATNRPTTPKDRLAFDRWDRLGLRLLLWLIALASVGVSVVGPLLAWARGEAMRVPFLSPVSVPELDRVGLRHEIGSYDLLLDHPTATQRILDLVPGVIVTALVLVGVWLVLRFMRSIASGDPFAPSQVRRLRVLAAVLMIGVPIAFFARLACLGAVLSGVDLGGLSPTAYFSIPWLPIVTGLCVALVAEAFKAGSRLRDDVDGLI